MTSLFATNLWTCWFESSTSTPLMFYLSAFANILLFFSFQGDIRNSLRAGRVMLMLDISGVPHTPHFASHDSLCRFSPVCQSDQSAIWPVWQSGQSGNLALLAIESIFLATLLTHQGFHWTNDIFSCVILNRFVNFQTSRLHLHQRNICAVLLVK